MVDRESTYQRLNSFRRKLIYSGGIMWTSLLMTLTHNPDTKLIPIASVIAGLLVVKYGEDHGEVAIKVKQIVSLLERESSDLAIPIDSSINKEEWACDYYDQLQKKAALETNLE